MLHLTASLGTTVCVYDEILSTVTGMVLITVSNILYTSNSFRKNAWSTLNTHCVLSVDQAFCEKLKT